MTSNDDVGLPLSAGRGPLALRVLWQLWWTSVPVWTLGFGAWIPFAWRLAAARHWRDAYVLVAYVATAAAETALIAVSAHGVNVLRAMWEYQLDEYGAGLTGAIGVAIGLVAMFVGAVHALVVYRPAAGFRGAPLYRPLETRDEAVLRVARHRVRRRAAARRLLVRHPERAARLSIGRPDQPRRYDDGGLVDINHAPDSVLATHLGLKQPEIDSVLAARGRLGRFSTAAELAVCAGLPAYRVDELRDFVVCL